MKLDNKTLELNATVYDLALGQGVIVSLNTNDTVRVDFVGGVRTYDVNGIGPFQLRTLYHAQPIIKPPMADPITDGAYRALVNAAHAALGAL